MVGRLVLGAVGHRVHPERAVWGSTGFALAGSLVLWVDPGNVGAWAALPVLGLSLSMLFPLVMGRTAVYLGEARATRAVGYQIGASAIGFTLLPALVGFLADEHGIETAAPVIVAIVIVVGALWWAIERTTSSARTDVSVDRRGERSGR
jgi:fucose permease